MVPYVIADSYPVNEHNVELKKVGGAPLEPLEITAYNAFDFLLDVDRNKDLLKSKDYRSSLAKAFIEHDKIKELAVVDGYIFKETGLSNDLLKVLAESLGLVSQLPEGNQKSLYLCLIDASIAGLKTEAEDQKMHYANAYKWHRSIDRNTTEFEQTKLIGLVSQALSFSLAGDNTKAEKIFLHGIFLIDKDKAGENDYYLLFKYIAFLVENHAYDKVDKWLNHALTIAKEGNSNYYKALSYYHLVLLKIKQGFPDVSAQYLREYQLSKAKLNTQGIVRIAFVESSYYDFASTTFVKKDKGIAAFWGLAALIIASSVGTSLYVCRNTKVAKWKAHKIVRPDGIGKLSVLVPKNRIETGEICAVDDEPTQELSSMPVQYINDLKKMAENNDPLFMKKFKQFFRDFADYVGKEAETPLNLAELEVCAYTKLGYTTKEVAYYRGDSIRSVENRKYRIRRKLNLPRDVDFTDWVMTA